MLASMAVQKLPTTRGWVVRELLNQSHDLQVYDSSVPYEPEVRKRDCRKVRANFGFGTLNLGRILGPGMIGKLNRGTGKRPGAAFPELHRPPLIL